MASCFGRPWLWLIDIEAELVTGNDSVSEKLRNWRCSEEEEEEDEEKFGVRIGAEEMVTIGLNERGRELLVWLCCTIQSDGFYIELNSIDDNTFQYLGCSHSKSWPGWH
ncbi:hypothetical protein ACFX2F_034571 [Malus domestica]